MSTFSIEHKTDIKQQKKEKILILIFRILIILIFILGWELLAKLHIINTFLSSSPSNVLNTTFKLIDDGSILKHISITMYEVIVSFSIASIIGIIISTILWSNKVISKIVD